MGVHDTYGKKLFEKVAGARFISIGPLVQVAYDGNTSARIDGVIEGACAIEIESRTDKQIRGAIIDLLCHPLPKKLLVIIPAYMNNPDAAAQQCRGLLNKLKRPGDTVRVVLLCGTGLYPDEDEDTALLEKVLEELECL